MTSPIRRFVERLVDFSGRQPLIVLFLALCTLGGTWWYASHLELHSDIRELLPRDSPGFKAFEHQLGRVGGGATLIIIAESPDRKANERYIDDLSARLDKMVLDRKACVDKCAQEDQACKRACGPELISYIEHGTKDVRKFFEDTKWLYADLADLKDAYNTLDFQIAVRSGSVTCLECDDKPKPAASDAGASDGGAREAGAADPNSEKKAALGMDEYRDRWKSKANKHDDFPTGYFASEDGGMIGLRIVTQTTGTGDSGGDTLLARLGKVTGEMNPAAYHPSMKIGFAGDIPNAVAEKESIASEAIWASGIAAVLVLGGVVFFYRSPWSLVVIALPAFVGVGAAYSFAMWRYGYVNTSGAFLGAIILGNGINYPIVLLSRYREFRARGLAPDVARRDAVWNAFRAELVGAMVGSIAYGSLTITQFRGFSQFGMIGFVGMLLVWVSMIPCVPALIVIIEWVQARVPKWLRDPESRVAEDGSRGPIMRVIASATERRPWVFLAVAGVLTLVAAAKLPSYLRDPWEYNFDKLGSRGSKHGGAGEWSNKAEKVFGGKMNIAGALMLADTPEQVPLVKAEILRRDDLDPKGKLIAEVATVADLLPGTVEEQRVKLEVLASIRERLTPDVLDQMPDDERKRIEEIRPPDSLAPIAAKDLPALLRRRFEENSGVVGTVFYVKYYNFADKNDISHSDGHTLLRIANTTDRVKLPDGTEVLTASRSTIFSEMIRSMERDGPLATAASFLAVAIVVIIATHSVRGAFGVLLSLLIGVTWTIGGAALADMKLNFLNFIALPITFGIGCEYPFNVYDRSRLLGGDITAAVKRVGGAVALCSFTTTVGYGSLLFADNQALQSFGQLAMSGEIACLVGALLVLPALLHVMARKKQKKTAT